ncbi:hypothetical protein AC1031_016085 [Aphanomyces cochlioides]|nr:hypothetical protein AC1031_016085 [Aphanomyces cochlioides]
MGICAQCAIHRANHRRHWRPARLGSRLFPSGSLQFGHGGLFITDSYSRLNVMAIYALNVLSQGFGTSAVVKINASWYTPTERGVFSGVFNIFVASGYYLALGSGHSIIMAFGWPYLFFIPSALLLIMTGVVAGVIANEPPTAALHPQQATAEKAPPTQFSRLIANKTLWGYLAAVFCLSWTRDGLLNWMYAYFDSVRLEPLSADDHAILGGAWTLGGFVGGVLCGWISDCVFHSKRMPPVILFSVVLAACFILLYTLAASLSIVFLGLLVFTVSVFLLGNYTLLSYTVPADLPVDVAAGASGLFTAVRYDCNPAMELIVDCFVVTLRRAWQALPWALAFKLGATSFGLHRLLRHR